MSSSPLKGLLAAGCERVSYMRENGQKWWLTMPSLKDVRFVLAYHGGQEFIEDGERSWYGRGWTARVQDDGGLFLHKETARAGQRRRRGFDV